MDSDKDSHSYGMSYSYRVGAGVQTLMIATSDLRLIWELRTSKFDDQ